MHDFNEILTKVFAITNSFASIKKDDFKAMFQAFDKLEAELQNNKVRARDKAREEKITVTNLESIHEDDTEPPKIQDNCTQSSDSTERTSSESTESRRSQKRSKHEVEGMESPELEKRQKRNASVKAKSIITKQVNVNLTQKLRRENSSEKGRRRRGKDADKENSEPLPIVQVKQEKISIPAEPEPEPEAMEVIPTVPLSPANVKVKKEPSQDDIAMPPPAAPKSKSRKGLQKEKSEESTDDESSNTRRTTSQRRRRTCKQTDTVPAPTARSSRSTRASSRATRQAESEEPPPETRPKRTRAKKAVETNADAEKEIEAPVENGMASPAEKPRPKRTRRAQKAAEKEAEKLPKAQEIEPQPEIISPKDERVSNPDVLSPVLQIKNKLKTKVLGTNLNSQDKEINDIQIKNTTKILNNNVDLTDIEKIQSKSKTTKNQEETETNNTKTSNKNDENIGSKKDLENAKVSVKKTTDTNGHGQDIKDLNIKNIINSNLKTINSNLKEMNTNLMEINSNLRQTVCIDVTDSDFDNTRVINTQRDSTVTISKDLDQTMVLPNGVYNHAPITPIAVRALNETVVLEHKGEPEMLGKPQQILDTTVVIDKVDVKTTNLTDDNSLITDDSDTAETDTPQKKPPLVQPTSAVKERVQQFEEMATRVTRTKTRAMAKKEEQPEEQTPPDKVSKAVISSETLSKMNSMIFNGKPPQISKSASKPRAVTPSTKSSLICSSASKLSGINKAREADDLRREREDARKKKEALLEAKREAQRRKREEKVAAAAAAREAAERERRAAMEAAVRERMEKQAHADLGKLERLKEAERKKQETARKVAETEERRKAEEQARQQRLADEQRRAEEARRKQREEAARAKKEVALMEKEMERKQMAFLEKQKMNKRKEGDRMLTPHKAGSPRGVEPAYMLDGFQYLYSDEELDEDAIDIPVPAWSVSKARREALCVQARVGVAHVDALFSVRAHTPDLRDIFPNIERARLKRTSSAVWRTPPARLPALPE